MIKMKNMIQMFLLRGRVKGKMENIGGGFTEILGGLPGEAISPE